MLTFNWFFDEWMETTKTIDYKLKSVKRESGTESNYAVTFKRRGRSQMPIDFEMIAKDGKEYNFHIPNTWFVKETNSSILPRWYGWDRLHPTYTCSVTIPSGIKNLIIDPTFRLADIYMPNNYKKVKLRGTSIHRSKIFPDWKKYEINWRPDLWYNAIDGLKIGVHLDGGYLNLKNKFWLTAWFNSTLFQNGIPDYNLEQPVLDGISPVSFNFWYSTNTHRFIRNSEVNIAAQYLDGLWGGNADFTIQVNAKNNISIGVKSMYRKTIQDLQYLL
jgi:aminopeptidase N